MSSQHLIIIISILMLANCEVPESDVFELPVRVFRFSTKVIEFQFDKKTQIEPISLRIEDDIFYFFESESSKSFRDPKPSKRLPNKVFTIDLEYRYVGKKDIKERTFQHRFKDNLEEVILVRFPISTTSNLPPTKMCTTQNCGSPEIEANDEFDIPTKPIEESHTGTLIDQETIDESCESDYGYTDELLNTALRHSQIGTHLLLKGLKNTLANPVDRIRDIITQDLNLPHLKYNILQAKYTDEGLLFEMKTTKDVIEILAQAKNILEKGKNEKKIELSKNQILVQTGPLIDIRFDRK